MMVLFVLMMIILKIFYLQAVQFEFFVLSDDKSGDDKQKLKGRKSDDIVQELKRQHNDQESE